MILGGFGMRGRNHDLAHDRARMVARDLRARGIRDPRVLAAMEAVPREVFVPPDLRDEAYADRALPIGHGQTISQPYIVALMAEALELSGRETVLEIGVGTGYACSILAELANWVVGIERVPELAATAGARLRELGIDNVDVHVADGWNGWPADAPYEAIMVSAAAERLPPALTGQLAEGGRLAIPLGEEGGTQLLTVLVRRGQTFESRGLCPCRFVPLVAGEILEEEGEAGGGRPGKEPRADEGPGENGSAGARFGDGPERGHRGHWPEPPGDGPERGHRPGGEPPEPGTDRPGPTRSGG